MADKLQQLFIQSVAINGEKINRDLVVRSSYIESLGLRGPILMMDVHDYTRDIIDNKKLNSQSIITITAGDATGTGELFKDDFRVISYPLENDLIRIQAVSKGVAAILVRSPTPTYVNGDTAANIIGLFTKMPVQSSAQERTLTIHVNNGDKPAYPLMRMARESGAAIWSAKGKIFFRKYSEFASQSPAFKYEASNPSAEKTITKARYITNDYMERQATDYNFVGFNSTEDFQSAGNSAAPTRFVSSGDPQTLANLSTSFKPKMDIECNGNPNLTVGMTLSVLINRYSTDSQSDESVPRKMVIGSITHCEDRVGYRVRMILGVFE